MSIVAPFVEHWLEPEIALWVVTLPQRCDGSLDWSFMVDPLSYFSFQPVLHDWCYKLQTVHHLLMTLNFKHFIMFWWYRSSKISSCFHDSLNFQYFIIFRWQFELPTFHHLLMTLNLQHFNGTEPQTFHHVLMTLCSSNIPSCFDDILNFQHFSIFQWHFELPTTTE